MKIINDDVAYIQKNDIIFLYEIGFPIPETISSKVFITSNNIIEDSYNNKFIKITDQDDINYLKNEMFWLLDYRTIKDFDLEDLHNFTLAIDKCRNELAESYNNLSKRKKKENKKALYDSYLLSCDLNILREFAWFKEKKIELNLPKNVEYPEGYTKEKTFTRIIKKIKSNF